MWMGPLGQMVMVRPHQGWQAMQPPFDPLGTFVQRAENHAPNRGHSAMATAAIAKTSKAAPFPWAAEDIRRIFTAGRVFPLPLLAMYRHRADSSSAGFSPFSTRPSPGGQPRFCSVSGATGRGDHRDGDLGAGFILER